MNVIVNRWAGTSFQTTTPSCSICKKQSTVVIIGYLQICKGCLLDAVKEIDKAVLANAVK